MKKSPLDRYYSATVEAENRPVLEFLKNQPAKESLRYLEVGAGLGRFPNLLKNDPSFSSLDITCLEINPDLCDNLKKQNLKTIQGSVTDLPFPANSFDVVHCAHVIEHFGYPDITNVLDELMRVTKTHGHIIIRSPLMHGGFYNDIDHVRPYPPKCILQYFDNQQQQKQGQQRIKLIRVWWRKDAYGIPFELPGINALNLLLKMLWTKWHWPQGKANGYVAIFEKIL